MSYDSSDGNKVIAQITTTARYIGKGLKIRSFEVAKIENGLLKTIQSYFDLMTMMGQLEKTRKTTIVRAFGF